jgi:hypothetical protein
MSLQEAEKVSITILMDNSTDFLLTNSAHAKRPSLIVNERFQLPPPIAEHGFSALVNIVKDIKIKQKKIAVYIKIVVGITITKHFSLIQG